MKTAYNKTTRHLLTLIDEDFTSGNYTYQSFDKFNDQGYPLIPMSPGLVIQSMCKATQGLYVIGGYAEFTGRLNNVFQEYEHEEAAFTGYPVVWMKLRFAGPKFVTLMIWDRGTEVIPLCTRDGNVFELLNDDLLYKEQMKAIEKSMDIIHKLPLPNPPVTYDFI